MRRVDRAGLIDREMKPSNIFIGDHGEPLIGDFSSIRLESDDATFTPGTGTVHCAAPRLFKGNRARTKLTFSRLG
jgi:serine/threonine protein kinase